MVNIVLNLQLQETCSFPSLDNNRLNVQMKIEKKPTVSIYQLLQHLELCTMHHAHRP